MTSRPETRQTLPILYIPVNSGFLRRGGSRTARTVGLTSPAAEIHNGDSTRMDMVNTMKGMRFGQNQSCPSCVSLLIESCLAWRFF